jgi:chromosome segregation ATPase
MVKWCWKFPRARKRGIAVLGLSWLVVPLVAAAAVDAEAEPRPKSVTLDQLLTLPSALPLESGQRGGLTRAEWSSRFAAAEAEVETAKADLAESLDRLSELVGKTSNWKVAAPGVQAGPSENSPVNYGLSQEIQQNREDVTRAERKLRALSVEANLAGVPENWYKKHKSSD